jgi:hypothetical protein
VRLESTRRTTAPLNSISLDSGGLVRNGKNNADKQRKFAKATASRISAVCSLLILGASWLGRCHNGARCGLGFTQGCHATATSGRMDYA